MRQARMLQARGDTDSRNQKQDRGETREEEAKQETTPQDRGKRQAHQTNTEVRTLALPSILPLVN